MGCYKSKAIEPKVYGNYCFLILVLMEDRKLKTLFQNLDYQPDNKSNHRFQIF